MNSCLKEITDACGAQFIPVEFYTFKKVYNIKKKNSINILCFAQGLKLACGFDKILFWNVLESGFVSLSYYAENGSFVFIPAPLF